MALQGSEEMGEPVEEPEDLDDQDAVSISPAEEITLPPGPGSDDRSEQAALLPWDRFSAWLHCICVVGFDLELGQAVEVRGQQGPENSHEPNRSQQLFTVPGMACKECICLHVLLLYHTLPE